jgi:hypothetical protein
MGARAKSAGLVTLGQEIDGYTAIEQAPVDYIQGSRSRYFDGHCVRGSWSDPWWMYAPGKGWALAKTWRNKDTCVHDWAAGKGLTVLPFAAREELVITAWEPAKSEEQAGAA